MNIWKVAVPWLLAQFGVRKWLKDRLLHVPDAVLPDCAAQAGVTHEQWRAVEAVQAKIIYDGIVVKVLP